MADGLTFTFLWIRIDANLDSYQMSYRGKRRWFAFVRLRVTMPE
jgi:hypothetical protein